MRIARFLVPLLALIASGAFAAAHAGGNHGYHGGHHGGMIINKNYSSSQSFSKSYSSSSVTIKNSNGGANYLFGAAAIISALNPPQPQRIIVKGGDVRVQVNFIGAGASALPNLKGPGTVPYSNVCPEGEKLANDGSQRCIPVGPNR